MRTCPACGDVYDEDVLVCANDGAALDDWAPDTAVASDDPLADTVDDGPAPDPRARLEADSASDRSGVRTSPLLYARHLPSLIEPVTGLVLGDRYVLGERLAVGGFGVVFEAQDLRLHKRVAVKVLSPRICQDEEMLHRFRREAIAASQIGHDAIIDVTDLGNEPGGLNYIVMEFLDGHDLSIELQDHGPFPLERAISLALVVAETLAVAHRRGIVHRDLKPANIFLIRPRTLGERIKIIDFGISKMLELPTGVTPQRLTSTGQVMGTPHYLAPEQASMGMAIDARTDVYSLGIILYEMLVGQPPFLGNALTIVASHLSEAPLPPSQAHPAAHLDAAVDALVLRAIEKEPGRRHGSMTELASELMQLRRRLNAPSVPPPISPSMPAVNLSLAEPLPTSLPRVSTSPPRLSLPRVSLPRGTLSAPRAGDDRLLIVVISLAIASLIALFVLLLAT